jgi:Na+-translocating ferredoxin:NAD+ oxidoreductase RnfG subunit
MKKIIITFSFFAMLSTVACDTSNKATTAQVATSAPQAQTIAAPTAIPDSVADYQVKKFQAKKAMKAKMTEMAPPEKTVASPVPVKQ